MTPEEVLIEKINEKIEAFKNDYASKTAVEAFEKKFDEALASADVTAKMAELDAMITKHSEAIEALKNTNAPKVSKFIEESKKAIETLVEKVKNGDKILRGDIAIKTVGDILTANITGSAQPLEHSAIRELRVAVPFTFDLCNVFPTTAPYVDMSEDAPEGTAMPQTEGEDKAQIDFNVNGITYTPQYVAANVTVSRQVLNNIPAMQMLIERTLLKRVLQKANTLILSGNGTTDLLKGITAFAQSWSAGTYANLYTDPNLYHVLLIAVAQVRNGEYDANGIALNPADAVGLKLAIIEKQINLPEALISGGQMFISGVPIYESSAVTANTVLVGDWSMSNIAIQEDYNIMIDPYTGMKKNKVVIQGELELTHFVHKADANAFVKVASISNAITALTKLSS